MAVVRIYLKMVSLKRTEVFSLQVLEARNSGSKVSTGLVLSGGSEEVSFHVSLPAFGGQQFLTFLDL